MLFNSLSFVLFFLVVYFFYRVSNHRLQNYILLLSSLVFYAFWNWKLLVLLCFSIALNYYFGLRIYSALGDRGRANRYLMVILGVNIIILGFFKYFHFFVDSLLQLLGYFGLHISPPGLKIVLPVGISFYTFQKMSYVIDIYRGDAEPAEGFIDFAIFASFFPQLVAGPIERAKHLLPQIQRKRLITAEQVSQGLYLLGMGLFKKIFVADNLAKIADSVFQKTGIFSGGIALLGIYAFAFQIYCDFSGYTDMARGLSKLMGIDLVINFRFPYFVTNPREFWRNWHISLSNWLRDYLYIPFGGNRFGRLMQYRNIFFTMVLGGLWHGAAWTFVLWGAYHGILLILHRVTEAATKSIGFTAVRAGSLWTALKVIGMFHLACLGWLIFRSESIGQVRQMLLNMALHFTLSPTILRHYLLQIAFFVLPLMILEIIQRQKNDMLFLLKQPSCIRVPVVVSLGFLTLAFGDFGLKQFIYFQF